MLNRLCTRMLCVSLTALLAGCGGGSGPPPTFAIGGTVSGLTGAVVLRNNGADELMVSANGPFAFSTALASGSAYSVTIQSQPSYPAQNCAITRGSGAALANVTTVAVACSGLPNVQLVADAIGTNGRTCESCHLPHAGWSIRPVDVELLFLLTRGVDPLFNAVDADRPTPDLSSAQARYDSFSMLRKGLFRRGAAVPANAEYEIVAFDDPLGAGASSTGERSEHPRR